MKKIFAPLMLVASCTNNSLNTPPVVENPDALANWANKYRGHEYVKWYEFATAKWAAPKRFTCTTLVWWCAKKAYGVNVSSWYSPLVTPSGLFIQTIVLI